MGKRYPFENFHVTQFQKNNCLFLNLDKDNSEFLVTDWLLCFNRLASSCKDATQSEPQGPERAR
jgi:hypothetical protein